MMTTTTMAERSTATESHGDGEGLELAVTASARLDPRRSFLAVGEVGTGKTCLAQSAAAELLADGGRVVVLDRYGEYAEAPGDVERAAVVDLGAAAMDPLRIFAGADRLRHTEAVVRIMGSVDAEGRTRTAHLVSSAVAEAVGAGASSIAEVATALTAYDDAAVAGVGEHLGIQLRSQGLSFLAGPGEVPVLDADYISLRPPPDLDWFDPGLAEQVLLYLAVALAQAAVAGPGRDGALVLDGVARASAASPAVCQLVVDGVRQGRRQRMATWVLATHVDDLAGLSHALPVIPNRLLLGSAAREPMAASLLGPDWARRLGAPEGWLARSPSGPILLGRSFRAVWADGRGRVAVVDLPEPPRSVGCGGDRPRARIQRREAAGV